MADNNNNDPNQQGEKDGKIHAPTHDKEGAVGINSEAFFDEIDRRLQSINGTLSLPAFGIGNATAGNNQQTGRENIEEELAPRTTTTPTTSNTNSGDLGPSPEETEAPKEGVDDVLEQPETIVDEVSGDLGGGNSSPSDSNTPNPQGNPQDEAAMAETNAELAATANEQGNLGDPGASASEEKKPDEAANSGIVAQIMQDYKKKVEEAQTREVNAEQASMGESETRQALAETTQNNSGSDLGGGDLSGNTTQETIQGGGSGDLSGNTTQETTQGGGSGDLSGNTTQETAQGGGSGSLGGETTTAQQGASQDSEQTPQTAEEQEAAALFESSESEQNQEAAMEQQAQANRAARSAAKNKGLEIGRSVGYGAKIEDNGNKITPFGPDEESSRVALSKFRDSHTEEAKAQGDDYYNGYAEGYNEGMEEGIKLKREADAAARNATLQEEQSSIEYQVGAILGIACGAASAKGESEIDTSYEVPKENGEKETVVVKGPMAPVRNAAMSKKQTPDGRLEGDALERAFMQNYNMAQEEGSKRARPTGPEKDADYQAGYDRGYKLGGQTAEGQAGDEDLLAEKKAYNEQKEDAPKAEKQKKAGFYDGYNKGQIDTENSKAAAKEEAIKARNENPVFMSGFATGNMQGFLKALLDPSGTDLLTALNDTQVMKDGGIPEFFPIPDAIRTNVKAVLGQGGDPAVQELISKPLFQEGLLMGYNAGYGRGEQNRMTFKREQFKLHPDYQESQKKVYQDKNMGQLKAQLTVDYRELQKKEEPSEQEQTQLDTYSNTITALDTEVNKQSEFYQRGVINSYNAALPEEEKRVKDTAKQAYFADPEYQDGKKFGEAIAPIVHQKKKKIKEWRRNGVDITAANKGLNDKIQQARKTAQSKGKKYFDGYARAYSDYLREQENKANETDVGNKLEDAEKLAGRVNGARDFYDQHKEEAKKAFEDGATQGYNLYYENKKINVKNGQKPSSKDFTALKDKHVEDKRKAYEADEKLKDFATQRLAIFEAGYAFIEDTNEPQKGKEYGAQKGLWDVSEFNKGFEYAKEDAQSGTDRGQEGTDAYKVGYHAGKKLAQYNTFRDNMIGAQQRLQQEQTSNGSTPSTAGRDHTQHAATENSIADTGALAALDPTPQQKQEATPVEMQEQQGAVYTVNVAEHESQARDSAENRKWVTKAIYLKEGVSLQGTELADATVSIQVKDEEGNTVTKTMSNKPADVQVARDFYGNKTAYIEQLAEAYVNNLKETDDTLKAEGAVASMVGLFWGTLKENYEAKLETIKQAYITGYNALFDSIKGGADTELVKAWNHDMAYIEGIKSQAGENPRVQALEVPTPPTAGLEMDTHSKEYQAGHLEGIQMGQKIRSGLVDLDAENNPLANMQGGDYQRGYEEGKAIGIKTGEVAANEMEKAPPNEQDIKTSLAEQREDQNVAIDPEFERGYIEGFFVDYWKTRDYYYGRHLGYRRANNGDVDGPIEAEEGISIQDNEAFFNGYTKGRENARLGKEEGATGKEGEEENTFEAKVRNIVLEVAWRNAALVVADELNITPRLGRVFSTNENDRVYHQFAETKSMQALQSENIGGMTTTGGGDLSEESANAHTGGGGSGDLGGGSSSEEREAYIKPPAYAVDSLEDIVNLPAVANIYSATGTKTSWTDLTPEEQLQYAAIFQETYEHHYPAVYNEAMIDMTNLSMIVAMDPNGTGVGTGMGGDTDSSAIEELMKKIEDLFANGNRQNFIIDELDLIDRFYDLERRIEERHGPIRDMLEDVETYRLAMEYYQDADSTLLAAEIQQLETDIQALEDRLEGTTAADKKDINKEKRLLERELKEKKTAQKKQTSQKDDLQREWEEAEENVKEEIDGIREYMEEHLGFETPLESNEDILEYIKINLETSEKENNGEKVYQDPNIFNNLVLQGIFDYEESAEFDAYVKGDGSLTIDAHAEKMKVEGIETKIEREGFIFTAKGLEHDHTTNSFTLFDGNLVTPKIEGGRHAGVKLDYDFHTFRLQKGYTIKSQIETQLDKLQGG